MHSPGRAVGPRHGRHVEGLPRAQKQPLTASNTIAHPSWRGPRRPYSRGPAPAIELSSDSAATALRTPPRTRSPSTASCSCRPDPPHTMVSCRWSSPAPGRAGGAGVPLAAPPAVAAPRTAVAPVRPVILLRVPDDPGPDAEPLARHLVPGRTIGRNQSRPWAFRARGYVKFKNNWTVRGFSAGYRRKAAECFALAQTTSDPEIKAEFAGIARGWLRLAEQADLNTFSEYKHRPALPRARDGDAE